MSNALNKLPITATYPDPAGDATLTIARVPEGSGKMTLVGASACLGATFDADGSNHVALTLQKIGVDGLASPVALTSALGGASVDWAAGVAKEFVLSTVDGALTLLAGEYIQVVNNETGTVGPGLITSIFLELAPGVG